MAILEKLKAFEDVKGYLGAGLFSPEGELIDGTSDISGLKMELIGTLLNDVLLEAQEMTEKAGFGASNFIQVNSDMGMLFAKCFNSNGKHFHTVLFVKPEGNVAMAKMKLQSVVDSLVEEF